MSEKLIALLAPTLIDLTFVPPNTLMMWAPAFRGSKVTLPFASKPASSVLCSSHEVISPEESLIVPEKSVTP